MTGSTGDQTTGVDSYLVPETLVKPRSFTGLMSVYESNFLRLKALVPDLPTIQGAACSTVESDLPLHFDLIERTRYTCTLTMTYLFARDRDAQEETTDRCGAIREDGMWLADPDLRVRVYFDGQLAEVMHLGDVHRHRVLRQIAASHREELDLRWRRNVMLNKWLEFCLDAGHKIEN
ncbi:MAG: DUF1249 domain-containing protein [Woeseiaceae bacterium]